MGMLAGIAKRVVSLGLGWNDCGYLKHPHACMRQHCTVVKSHGFWSQIAEFKLQLGHLLCTCHRPFILFASRSDRLSTWASISLFREQQLLPRVLAD